MRAYLDNLATTPLDPRVFEAMKQVFEGPPGNPHARMHPFGVLAAQRVEAARQRIAHLIAARSSEVFFVPSATAANNLALIGIAARRAKRGTHILLSAIEHASVLEPAQTLREQGFDVEIVPVGSGGVVEPEEVRRKLRRNTILVSVMAVNNEIGTIQPVKEIAAEIRAHTDGVILHCDAAQAVGKVSLDFSRFADLITLSGHKAYGPQGCAALVVRGQENRPKPLIFGGGQEEGLWPGTLPVALCVGLATALELAEAERAQDTEQISRLREALWQGIVDLWPSCRANGALGKVVPHCLSVTFAEVSGETVIARLAAAGIAVSMGSACSTKTVQPSHVLKAIGLRDEEARRTIRFGLGKFTKPEEIAYTLEVLCSLAKDLRG